MALPIINLSLIPVFPAKVTGDGPVTIIKNGLEYVVGWDIETFSVNPAPGVNTTILSHDPDSNETGLISIADIAEPSINARLATTEEAIAGTPGKLLEADKGKSAIIANAKAGVWAQVGTGASTRTLGSKAADIMDVRDFLDFSDLSNPSVNVGPKITAAARVLRDHGGGRLIIPDGVLYASGVRLFPNIIIEGQSQSSILRAPAGTTDDIILGFDADESASAYSYFGTSTFDLTKGSNRSGVKNLTLDGNFRGGATSGPFVVWGYGTIVQDVMIMDAGRDGMRTEWTDGSVSMEGTFNNIVIDKAQWNGWSNSGPHDSHVSNMKIIDAGQAADDTYAGAVCTASNSRFFNLHVWHRAASTNRARYACISSGFNEFIGCHFEGCRGELLHQGAGDRVVGSFIYAPFGSLGTAMVVFDGTDNLHVGNRYSCIEVTSPEVYALQFGGANAAAGNIVKAGQFLGFSWGTPFNFFSSSGLNVIEGTGYCPASGATSFAGTPNATDSIDYVQGGTAINYRKPRAYGSFADDAAAATGGVPSGGLYRNSSTGALTVKA